MSELKLKSATATPATRKLRALTLIKDSPVFNMHASKFSSTMEGLHMVECEGGIQMTHDLYPGRVLKFYPAGISHVEFSEDA